MMVLCKPTPSERKWHSKMGLYEKLSSVRHRTRIQFRPRQCRQTNQQQRTIHLENPQIFPSNTINIVENDPISLQKSSQKHSTLIKRKFLVVRQIGSLPTLCICKEKQTTIMKNV